MLKNGKNIFPEELELLVAKLPFVSENMVYAKTTNNNDIIVAIKIVYNKELMESLYPDKNKEDYFDIIWQEIKKINKTLPTYKYIKHLIITDEPMIKTTTQKVKRYEEIKKIKEDK